MNGIIGMTNIALKNLDDREKVESCLNKITAASGHLLSLINEVLDMSRIESGRISLKEENVHLPSLIGQQVAQYFLHMQRITDYRVMLQNP